MKHFTLLELLVVIAILGILMTLLMPSLKKARKKTRSAVCKSNLKQFGVVYTLYCDDWGGYAPWMKDHTGAKKIWFENGPLSGYLGYDNFPGFRSAHASTIFNCPSSTDTTSLKPFFDYCGNTAVIPWVGAPHFQPYVNVDAISRPSEIIVIGDDYPPASNAWGMWFNTGSYHYRDYLGTRHSGNTNLLFLDMHVENMNRLKITEDMVIP